MFMGIRCILAASAVVALLAGCDTAPSPAAGLGARDYSVAGTGGPAIVLEAGHGDSRLSWSPIFLALSTDTTVFAYDRPGFHSGVRGDFVDAPDSDGIRTYEESVEHLRGLLAEARIAPPYLLVGHSLGGQLVLMYAKLHPEEVAGIVLVDGRTPAFSDMCERRTGLPMCRLPIQEQAPLPIQETMRGLHDGEPRLPTPSELGALPITVITAMEADNLPTDPNPDLLAMLDAMGLTLNEARARNEDFHAFWITEQRAFADGLANGRHVEATGARHYVHQQQPLLVIEEIRAMLDRLREQSGSARTN
jgi:pimeloyl-ACP methyl ester carboxylesterase